MQDRTGVSLARLPLLLALVGLAACGAKGDEDVEADDPGGLSGTDGTDADRDGVPASEDCNDADPSVLGPTTWFSDGDGDGYGNSAAEGYASCTRPTGASNNNLDCDDTRADTNPAAPEVCGGGDEDCDGLVDDDDDDAEGTRSAYADADLDGYGDADTPVLVCSTGAGAETVAGDCDDTREEVHPGADEICRNGLDDDCDGSSDPCAWELEAELSVEARAWSAQEGDFAGLALGRAGDVTGDGLHDLLVGIPYSDAHTYNGGAVAVLAGQAAAGGGRLVEGQVAALLLGTDESGYAGRAVASADFDGDGYSDVIMGAPEANTGVGASGTVALFSGPLVGTHRASGADAAFAGLRTGDRAGRSLDAASDVTGDGVVDLIIGSQASAAAVAPVAAWIVSDPLAMPSLGDVPTLDIDPLDRTRVHVVVSADIDGDGVGDIIVGSPDTGDLDSPEGAVYVHLGPFTSSRHLRDDADTVWTGSPGHTAGQAVIAERDFTGDGVVDLFVGSPGAIGGRGEVSLLADPLTGGVIRDEDTRWSGTPTAGAGYALSTTSDDMGSPLLLVGGPTADTSKLDGGIVWAIPASGAGAVTISDVAVAQFNGGGQDFAGEGAGSAVLGAGDLNGDSYEDIAVGAPNNASGGVAAGAVHVVLGQGM